MERRRQIEHIVAKRLLAVSDYGEHEKVELLDAWSVLEVPEIGAEGRIIESDEAATAALHISRRVGMCILTQEAEFAGPAVVSFSSALPTMRPPTATSTSNV